MADQISPTGSSVSGPPLAQLGTAAKRAGPEASRPVKLTEAKADQQVGKKDAGPGQSPESVVGDLNNYLEQSKSEIQFQMDKSTGQTVFQIINQSNGAVVMQVPSEEVLAMARNLQSMDKSKDGSGVLVNKEG